jgi:hypothetical protein
MINYNGKFEIILIMIVVFELVLWLQWYIWYYFELLY